MHWIDEGLVLGCRSHGEAAVILELMTRAHGRHLGIVHGGRSRRLRPVLQPGNGVGVTWRARLDEHLGHYVVEPDRVRSASLIGAPLALYAIGALALHLRLLPERDPHPDLFEAATIVLDRLDEPDTIPALFVRFELLLLSELGYGLDLERCAATGVREDLVYVSPRSGRAVSRAAGAPYDEKLLRLPPFLLEAGKAEPPAEADIRAGFELTGFFLDAHVYAPQGRAAPDERARFVAAASTAFTGRSAMVRA